MKFLYHLNYLSIGYFAILYTVLAGYGSSCYSQEIILYLQSPTDKSIWVSWKTGSGTETIVKTGTDSLNLNQTFTGSYQKLEDPGYNGNYFYHSVQLTGLQPSSFYYYKAITGAVGSKTYRFKTQPVNGNKTGHFRFLIIGDNQIANRDGFERLMAAAKDKVFQKYGGSIEEKINLIMNVGDQVDEGNLFQYENVHFGKSRLLSPNLPIMTAVGNHETYGAMGLEAYYPHFFYDKLHYKGIVSPGSENYYSFQAGRVVFAVLSSEHPNNDQVRWVQQLIDSVKVDKDVDWLISVAHRPIQAEQYIDDISPYIKNQVVPILTQSPKSVMLITGHHHLYARGQLRDFPMYHIISGAASWDQFWGQSVEKDYDNVQKTIDFWAYQIVDIDLEKQEMQVESYAIGSPKLGFTMNNVLIDSFHRTFGNPIPWQPKIVTEVPDTIQLPFTFESSEFQTKSGEELNSTQFQVSANEEFVNPDKDIIRDFENLYGTTGNPGFLPVDINKNINLLEYKIKPYGLSNGRYFIRVRHRDKNLEWSAWSNKKPFVITKSTEGKPEVSTAKTYYDPNEPIKVLFKNGPNNPKDWIGIYKKGDTPGGGQNSTDWKYTNASFGAVTLQVTDGGEYFIALFADDGYTEISDRIWVYSTSVPVTTASKPGFDVNEKIVINYSNAPSFNNDWIGIYKLNDIPGIVGSTTWKYVSGQTGSVTFGSLPKGYYFANYFLLNGYDEPGNRVYFSVESNTVSAEYNLTFETITIYPSPTYGKLNIDINNFKENIKTISVTTLLGKLVFLQNFKENQMKKTETIDLSNNQKGIYLISVTTHTSTITRKVILK